MCDNRHYTSTVVADMQRIAKHDAAPMKADATVEAERRRLYRAELAQELRGQLQRRLGLYKQLPVVNFDYMAGFTNGVTLALMVLDELSPAVTCDNPAN